MIKFQRQLAGESFYRGKLGGKYTRKSDFPAANEIALEIELEGMGAGAMGQLADMSSPVFHAHADPSLRGDNVELTFRQPLPYVVFKELAKKDFERIKKESNFVERVSHRCSIHVHLDFSHKTQYELLKFITLYALFEDQFFNTAGPERKDNHFCIPLPDAPRFVEQAIQSFQDGDYSLFAREDMRYMALNLNALFKFGSVEIRLHEGTSDWDRIEAWVEALYSLVAFATDKKNTLTPPNYIELVSRLGLDGFAQKYLPKVWSFISKAFREHGVCWSRSVQIAQDFAYCLDWSDAEKFIKAPPPKEAQIKEEARLDEIFDVPFEVFKKAPRDNNRFVVFNKGINLDD